MAVTEKSLVEAAEEADAAVVAVADEEIAEIDTKKSLQFLSDCLERQGLIYLGAVSPDTFQDYLKYQKWISSGNHGELLYLEKNPECRKSACGALPSAQTVIVFAFPYAPKESYPLAENETSRIAAYARMPDYHEVLKKLAEKALLDWQKVYGLSFDWRVTVDTVPILERAFAKKTGLGFIGKNTCFIHESLGSFLLLGEILTSAPFPIQESESRTDCGSCSLCQVECPTGALQKDYQIDSRKCLSYWTIEQRGPIPEEFWPGVGKYWFGCDICQLVCPYNQEAKESSSLASFKKIQFPDLYEVAVMNESQYQKLFGGTALTRAKRNGLRRNALIAMTVNQHPLLQKAIEVCKKEKAFPIQETLIQIQNYLESSAK